jgi:hypothetical protein
LQTKQITNLKSEQAVVYLHITYVKSKFKKQASFNKNANSLIQIFKVVFVLIKLNSVQLSSAPGWPLISVAICTAVPTSTIIMNSVYTQQYNFPIWNWINTFTFLYFKLHLESITLNYTAQAFPRKFVPLFRSYTAIWFLFYLYFWFLCFSFLLEAASVALNLSLWSFFHILQTGL